MKQKKENNNMTVNFIGGFIRWLAKGCRTNLFKETSCDNYNQNLLWAIITSLILIISIHLFGDHWFR